MVLIIKVWLKYWLKYNLLVSCVWSRPQFDNYGEATAGVDAGAATTISVIVDTTVETVAPDIILPELPPEPAAIPGAGQCVCSNNQGMEMMPGFPPDTMPTIDTGPSFGAGEIEWVPFGVGGLLDQPSLLAQPQGVITANPVTHTTKKSKSKKDKKKPKQTDSSSDKKGSKSKSDSKSKSKTTSKPKSKSRTTKKVTTKNS